MSKCAPESVFRSVSVALSLKSVTMEPAETKINSKPIIKLAIPEKERRRELLISLPKTLAMKTTKANKGISRVRIVPNRSAISLQPLPKMASVPFIPKTWPFKLMKSKLVKLQVLPKTPSKAMSKLNAINAPIIAIITPKNRKMNEKMLPIVFVTNSKKLLSPDLIFLPLSFDWVPNLSNTFSMLSRVTGSPRI